mgnify:CR=1 FL=1
MVVATRRAWRPLWLIGSTLMAAVVLKLSTVDMSGTGTVSRIVAFLGVGILLLVVGYRRVSVFGFRNTVGVRGLVFSDLIGPFVIVLVGLQTFLVFACFRIE